jgi:hypothetical protein
MKKFLEISKAPLIVGGLAALAFAVDSLIAPLLYAGAFHFVWIAFMTWTITTSMGWQDKARLLIGNIIGFLFALGIIWFGGLFAANIGAISIALVIAVFFFSGVPMYFVGLKKYWINSVPGIFMGIFLVFSNLGVGAAPDTVANAFQMLGIILLYSFIGCICSLASGYLIGKWKGKKLPEVDNAAPLKVEAAHEVK